MFLPQGEERADVKWGRTKEIDDRLRKKGCKLSKYEELASLGILVLITEDVEKITEEIKEVYERLPGKKGFGAWSMSKYERTMYGRLWIYVKPFVERH